MLGQLNEWDAGSLRRGWYRLADWLSRNRAFGTLVTFQHRWVPIPLVLFDLMFRNRVAARLLAPYGLRVFLADYETRRSNEDYWAGKRSMYWHLYRQNDILRDGIRKATAQPEIREILSHGDLDFLVPGFGLGKSERAMMASGLFRFRKLHSVDLNPFVCQYVNRRFGLHTRCAGLRELVADAPDFDVLLIMGKVLMVAPPEDVESFGKSLPARGCRIVIVIGEGSAHGNTRLWDNTVQYDLKAWLSGSYPGARFIEGVGEKGFYDYFAMIA